MTTLPAKNAQPRAGGLAELVAQVRTCTDGTRLSAALRRYKGRQRARATLSVTGTNTAMISETDLRLIEMTIGGEHAAFAEIVRRYQTLVCSVAYSVVGSVASSEDIGQEAFLIAWRRMSELHDPSKLKSWLATIARNLAKASLRRKRTPTSELPADEIPQNTPTDEQQIMDREELDLVWNKLAELPDSFREPLVLFYRQEQSVAEVADALELSTSAVKQRLSRGRAMLRENVLATIELSLRKTVPTIGFTTAVLNLLPNATATAATMGGAAAATKASSIGTWAASGALGAITGSLLGLLGGIFGAWCSWSNAQYASQRKMMVRQIVIYMMGMTIFMLPILAMMLGWRPMAAWGAKGYAISYAIWMLTFMSLNGVWIFSVIRGYRVVGERAREAGTSSLASHQPIEKAARQWEGRRWTSKTQLLSLPLIHVAFADPNPNVGHQARKEQGTARGWIAIGEHARGRVLAIGNTAVAPVAIGVMSCGIVSLGVLSVGVLSIGVVSMALLAYGVVAIGGLAAGGAIALGIVAAAPLAIGGVAAKGVLAIAWSYAAGQTAIAHAANTESATQYLDSSWAVAHVDWVMNLPIQASSQISTPWMIPFWILLLVGFSMSGRLAYRRRESSQGPV